MKCPHEKLRIDGQYIHKGTVIGIAWFCLDCETGSGSLPHLMTKEQREEAERIHKTGKREKV